MRIVFLIISALLLIADLSAQETSNFRSKRYAMSSDSIQLDSLSILPGSVKVIVDGKELSSGEYQINYTNSVIKFNNALNGDVSINYRSLPEYLSREYFNKDINAAIILDEKTGAFYKYETGEKKIYSFDKGMLEKRGSISRGISVGNNQDAIVNSSMNLQLSGRLTNDFQIQAAITDENLPIQPDGNSQQIQDFDKVFINIFNDRTRLIMGDFEIMHQDDHFFKLNKKGQGVMFTRLGRPGSSDLQLSTSVSGAVSKGKYNRMTFNGTEGNQGPYKLIGAQSESYIIILAGSEKVYIDGTLLTRGENNDYVIDYNTAELVFTTNRLITKNLRIVVEFEYSDRNYARYLLYNQNKLVGKKGSLRISLFNEQDIKTQPLQQDLTEGQISTLQDAGDMIDQAFTESIDSVAFQNDRVLYRKTDTLVNGAIYSPVYVYSTNPDEAWFNLGFTFVGEGNGNYLQIESDANGKVYQWIAPDTDSSKKGNSEPIILLVAPKKKQILNIGGDYKFSEKLSSDFEFSLTNNDINTYSEKNSDDNIGYALKTNLSRKIQLKDSLKGVALVNYQLIDRYFDPADRFRSVEFERDWNLSENQEAGKDEHQVNGTLMLSNNRQSSGAYHFNLLKRPGAFEAMNNRFSTQIKINKTLITAGGSYLFTEDMLNRTGFLRHHFEASRKFKGLTLGLREESENNLWNSLLTDSVANNSYDFKNMEFFLRSADSATTSFFASYKYRIDKLPFGNQLEQSSVSNDFKAGSTLKFRKRNKLSTVFTYRKLQFSQNVPEGQSKNEDNFNGRINLSMNWMGGSIRSSTFYEIGSGLELRKEYQFLQVTPGQGQFVWNDYNSDGITQLDEFELAAFQDTANYIRLFIPGNDYEKVLNNQFSQNLNIKMAGLIKKEKGLSVFFGKLTSATSFRVNSKNSSISILENLNPFYSYADDANLRSLNSALRNIFSFNKGNPRFGIDYIYSNNSNRTLLTNGIDSRTLDLHSLQLRWKVTTHLIAGLNAENGKKSFESEFFPTKDFLIHYDKAEGSILFQPNLDSELKAIFTYTDKSNLRSIEKSTEFKYSGEANLKFASKATALLKISYVKIDFNQQEINSSIAYEMLGGLKPGDNFTWELQYQQNIAGNMQLNVSYFGRKSKDSKTLHTGNVQIRAYF